MYRIIFIIRWQHESRMTTYLKPYRLVAFIDHAPNNLDLIAIQFITDGQIKVERIDLARRFLGKHQLSPITSGNKTTVTGETMLFHGVFMSSPTVFVFTESANNGKKYRCMTVPKVRIGIPEHLTALFQNIDHLSTFFRYFNGQNIIFQYHIRKAKSYSIQCLPQY